MVTRTRRALLGSSVAILATLAGCEGQYRETPTDSGADIEPGSLANPDHLRLRSRQSDRPVTIAEGADDRTVVPDVVTSVDRAERLTYAPDVDADAARTFVAETDFETASIVVDHASVRECYRLELCTVAWTRTEIETHYRRRLRAVDVPCEADVWLSAVTLIRVPAVLDPDALSGGGGSIQPGACGPDPDDGAPVTEDGQGPANRTTTDGSRESAGGR